MQPVFTDFNIDPVKATEIMVELDVTLEDFRQPKKFEQIKSIFDYLKQAEDAGFIARKIVGNKFNVDKVRMLWEYIELRKELQKKQLAFSELPNIDPLKATFEDFEKINERKEMEKNISDIKEQISKYE